MSDRIVLRVHLNSQFRQGTKNSRYSEAELASVVAVLNDRLELGGSKLRIIAEYLDNGAGLGLGFEMVP